MRYHFIPSKIARIKKQIGGASPGGPVVRNPLSNTGPLYSTRGQGAKIPHATGQLNQRAQLQSR